MPLAAMPHSDPMSTRKFIQPERPGQKLTARELVRQLQSVQTEFPVTFVVAIEMEKQDWDALSPGI